MEEIQQEFYSPTQLAKLLGRTTSAIYVQIHRNQLRVVKQGRSVLIPRQEVERVIAETERKLTVNDRLDRLEKSVSEVQDQIDGIHEHVIQSIEEISAKFDARISDLIAMVEAREKAEAKLDASLAEIQSMIAAYAAAQEKKSGGA